jgi:hypothetical protein
MAVGSAGPFKRAINIPEAVEMEKAVSLLPEKNREALRWSYVWQGGPGAMSKRLGVSKEGLCDLIRVGRVMLRSASRSSPRPSTA